MLQDGNDTRNPVALVEQVVEFVVVSVDDGEGDGGSVPVAGEVNVGHGEGGAVLVHGSIIAGGSDKTRLARGSSLDLQCLPNRCSKPRGC